MGKRPDTSGMTDKEKEAYKKISGKFYIIPKKEHRVHKETGHKNDTKSLFSHTAGILKQRRYAKLAMASVLASGLVYSFLYGFWQIPFVQLGFVRMAEITAIDIGYVILISVMAGLLVSLLKYKVDKASGSKLVGAGGIFAGFVSSVCPACQGITIAALGSTVAAIPLGFLVPYLWVLQIATIFIMGLSLYLTSNAIYTKTCISCAIPGKRSYLSLPKQSSD